MSESQDLVAALLEGDPAARESLLRAADPANLAVALQRLGERPEVAAAEVLTLVDLVVEDRGLRKTARRELHRLRSRGIQAMQPIQAAVAPAVARSDAPLPITQAWVTEIDPNGSRAIWLLAERPLGGIWFALLLLNEMRGLQDMSLLDSTRKRFAREFDNDRRAGGVRVLVPGDYALRLIRESVELTREAGVPGHTPEQDALQLLGEVAQRVLTPVVRHALRRRLEETGHIFVATDRLAAARLAVAAARALVEPVTQPEHVPLLRVMLAAGLARLLSAEKVGTRPAADVLIELIERASQQRAQSGPTETRPSGLILPR
ncbi:MAG: hypothetical protein LC797_06930 [Chloroflexi bacterium]|nr:hypothetical protein [Chloroflexota bacterium]